MWMQRTEFFRNTHPTPYANPILFKYVKYGFSVIRPSAVLYLKYGRRCKKGGGSVQRRQNTRQLFGGFFVYVL